jgi:carbonic anhydrase
MDQDSKNVLVHQNVANMVINTDSSLLAVIDLAVKSGVQDVIVCGHYDCSSIRSIVKQTDQWSPLSNWLGSVQDV